MVYGGSGKDFFTLYSGNGFSNIYGFHADRDTLGLAGGLKASDLLLRQVDVQGSYFTEVLVAKTGDLIAQLHGVHLQSQQVSWVAIADAGSTFKANAFSAFEAATTVGNRSELAIAGVTTSGLNTIL